MSHNFEKLVEVMNRLLAPDGCPWDVAQSHESLVPYLIEETYEVVDAIENKSPGNLKEELGDLILQVVFHAALAERKGTFSISDVNQAIVDKLIRRHPHVFGDTACANADAVTQQWDEIKAVEKKNKNEGLLDSVPNTLPALLQALKLTKKAAKVGFDWDKKEDILSKLNEELAELSEAFDSKNPNSIQDEAGDLLFVLVNWFRHHKIDPEAALRRSNQKFRKRFSLMEEFITKDKVAMTQLDLNQWDQYWNQAKNHE